MENKVFVMLRDWYEISGVILSMGELQEKLAWKCSVDDVLEGVYTFDGYLNAQRECAEV
ncbi:hypothetical protein LG329_16710 [Virgibacillus necropolis]|uniref:hypothetical protein n=1 Tax=Virgibacillus necropolis TaxID=163877 RepID=UPI00384D4395